MSRYQALIFDLDGTAINSSETASPSQRLIQTVAKYRSQIHLIAATGRPSYLAMPIIKALHLTDPCVILGGTAIIDPQTSQILKRTTLSPEAIETSLAVLKPHPYKTYVRDDHPSNDSLDIKQALQTGAHMICVEDVPEADFIALQKQLSAISELVVTTVPSWNSGRFVMLTRPDGTKEHAVTEVLARLNVPKSAAIGIGDGDNDLHLFNAVGLKIAMGNATENLKAAADLIAPTIDKDGLAQIIEQYAQ
jgi:HAD superfamily hydrolase (TIGR01484 family)